MHNPYIRNNPEYDNRILDEVLGIKVGMLSDSFHLGKQAIYEASCVAGESDKTTADRIDRYTSDSKVEADIAARDILRERPSLFIPPLVLSEKISEGFAKQATYEIESIFKEAGMNAKIEYGKTHAGYYAVFIDEKEYLPGAFVNKFEKAKPEKKKQAEMEMG